MNELPMRRRLSLRNRAVIASIALFALGFTLFHFHFSTCLATRPRVSVPAYTQYRHLVMVPCHGVHVFNGNVLDDASGWLLYSPVQFPVIRNHITQALAQLDIDPHSLLLFSGASTRAEVPASEAFSYYQLAAQHHNMKHHQRVHLEENALDSFENLLMSLCRFKELTGAYPERVTVVGFEFKKRRFVELHRHAIGYPMDRFKYIGIDDPYGTDIDADYMKQHQEWLVKAREGEQKYAFSLFQVDLFGCKGSLLEKKLKRDPFNRHSGVLGMSASCPEIKVLFSCPETQFDISSLPWS